MRECIVHRLMFGPGNIKEPENATHILSDKEADVLDMVCPTCGAKLFVYYRIVPEKGA